jgi:hypothetical protein
MGLSGLSASNLYMKIALSQAKVLCRNSKMDCIFTPEVKISAICMLLHKVVEKGRGKPVDIILKR